MSKSLYPNTFYRASVKALIKDTAGRALVVKEKQDTWDLPGGGVDHGETPEAALRRELKEELGIDTMKIKGVVATPTFYLELKQAWLLWIVYEVTIDTTAFSLGHGVTDGAFIESPSLKESSDAFEKMIYDLVNSKRRSDYN